MSSWVGVGGLPVIPTCRIQGQNSQSKLTSQTSQNGKLLGSARDPSSIYKVKETDQGRHLKPQASAHK